MTDTDFFARKLSDPCWIESLLNGTACPTCPDHPATFHQYAFMEACRARVSRLRNSSTFRMSLMRQSDFYATT